MKLSLSNLWSARSAAVCADPLARALRVYPPRVFRPYEHFATIDASFIVQWDKWPHESGAPVVIGYRRSRGGSMENWTPAVPSLGGGRLATPKPAWRCDISDVTALLASKAPLEQYCDLGSMAHVECANMLGPDRYTPEALALYLDRAGVLTDGEFRRRSDHLELALWDWRLCWMNDGGSHNFAAARYVAEKLGQPVPIIGRLEVRALSEGTIELLTSNFAMFVIPGEPIAKNALLEALRVGGVSYLSTDLPRPFVGSDGAVVLLPRAEARSLRAAATLAQAGCFDLNAHLSELLETQKHVWSEYLGPCTSREPVPVSEDEAEVASPRG